MRDVSLSLSEAQELVKNAHEALKVANKGLLEYPQWNQYGFQQDNNAERLQKAPDLAYEGPTAFQAFHSRVKLDSAGLEATIQNGTAFRYTISPDLAEAARLVAEASPSPIPSDYGVDIAKIVGQYRVTPNDTTMPQQVHRGPNGLDGYVPGPTNTPKVTGSTYSELRKRASETDFWLTRIAQRGLSPFAPAGYKPFDYPTILAASSFVGLGVITSDVYTGETSECAYFGNQQFTTSQLTFLNCKTALQVHWDWAWTMQDVVINNCTQGIVIVGGAGGGPGSTGQSVGSLILVDTVIGFTETAILTSLMSENSTSFLLQNANFIEVGTAIKDNVQNRVLMAGGAHVTVDSWGFGLLATSSTNSTFVNGQVIPAMNRSSLLTGPAGYNKNNWFQRRRPAYTNIGMSQVIDVKAWGAAGDGTTDDTGVLNSILDRAANLSSIVYFPFGVYKITDTLHVPVGSRIIGQAWSQIMATGAKFGNELSPRVVVKVGNAGEVGIVEIQSMLFTVSGPTAGAVLMEWNVHESTQGSAGMWDSHFRVGGAIGSNLQTSDCPKSGTTNPKCKAASLLLHLTPKSSAYLENIWLWTADHDLDLRGVQIAQSTDVWLYNLVTKGMVEMVTPVNENATLSANNMNGFMASILAWVREPDEVIGEEMFPGFQIYDLEDLNNVDGLTTTCKTALSQIIRCAAFLQSFQYPNSGRYFDNATEADRICTPSCGSSLKSWFDNVSSSCTNQTLGNSDPTRYGGYIYAAYNQSCYRDTKTGKYCHEILDAYPAVQNINSMTLVEMCSYCHTQKYILMQASAYTAYDVRAQDNLKTIQSNCGLKGPTEIPPPPVNVPVTPAPMCLSDTTYTIKGNDTCDTIALQYSVASAAIQAGNPQVINDCSNLIAGREICIPLSCETTYTLQDNDTCFSIEMNHGLMPDTVRKYNSWLDLECFDLQPTRPIIGSVICLSPQGGTYNDEDFVSGSSTTGPSSNTGYTRVSIDPPENATVAEGSPWFCGRWHTVEAGETCAMICVHDGIPAELFMEANPSLSPDNCDGSLKVGVTYCTGPDEYWNDAGFWGPEWPGSPTGPVSSSVPSPTSSTSS
ncbi:hypothetical protein ATERTT37_003762 [Aspergillus terreus]